MPLEEMDIFLDGSRLDAIILEIQNGFSTIKHTIPSKKNIPFISHDEEGEKYVFNGYFTDGIFELTKKVKSFGKLSYNRSKNLAHMTIKKPKKMMSYHRHLLGDQELDYILGNIKAKYKL